ncbi:MAG: ammonium transporter [Rhizobiales bacterium]|nr:ammonium transporter [Hyphomicrobiales bacterium]NRB13610.1 ammonium transporter [Hyphomicrobiales bacterium]
MKKYIKFPLMVGVGTLALTSVAHAAVDAESAFVFNTLLFLIGGFLVMFMAAGFSMLEAGMVRSKNVATICTKNISLYAISGIMFWLVGYNLMYSGVNEGFGSGFFGQMAIFAPDESAIAAGDYSAGYGAYADWFFQMVFCATASSIVSGTLAERIKLFPFLIFSAVLTAVIYPVVGSWEWGGGWLDQLGFADFAGSTLVHSVGGWAALVGALILGPRLGKYRTVNGKNVVTPFQGSNLPLATLGTFILWFGWFGFNGASQLALGSGADAIAIAKIFTNTNMAAAAGTVTALLLTQLLYKKVDLTMVLNGALAGLVAITAEPLTPSIGEAVIIGAVGSVLVVFAVPLLDKLKIDDVVGAISVHLIAGIWGTLIVPFSHAAEDGITYGVQALGVVAVGAFVCIASAIAWTILDKTIGIRVSEEEEKIGLDITELGLHAYPEFTHDSKI